MITRNTPEKTWVRCIYNGELRFITKHNNGETKWRQSFTFEDDGKVSDQPPSPFCHYEHYRPLTAEELNELLTRHIVTRNKKLDWIQEWGTKNLADKLAAKKPTWDELVWDASKGFGEKKADPEYEILEFRGDAWPYPYMKDSVSGKYKYKNEPHGCDFTHEECVSMGLKIHSVRRNSDMSVWTIGDKVDSCGPVPIEKFAIINNKVRVSVRWTSGSIEYLQLKNLKKPVERKPLFVTADGKEVFEGEEYWHVRIDFTINGPLKATVYTGEITRANSLFSTKEAAEEYVWMNKPCVSYEDVRLILKMPNFSLLRDLKEVARKRIKL